MTKAVIRVRALEKCNKECYTKGRGCITSTDGKCPHLHISESIHGIKLSTKDYFLPSKKKLVGKM